MHDSSQSKPMRSLAVHVTLAAIPDPQMHNRRVLCNLLFGEQSSNALATNATEGLLTGRHPWMSSGSLTPMYPHPPSPRSHSHTLPFRAWFSLRFLPSLSCYSPLRVLLPTTIPSPFAHTLTCPSALGISVLSVHVPIILYCIDRARRNPKASIRYSSGLASTREAPVAFIQRHWGSGFGIAV